MLALLSTVKSRLAIIDIIDTTYDDIPTNAIKAVSARSHGQTDRTLARLTRFRAFGVFRG